MALDYRQAKEIMDMHKVTRCLLLLPLVFGVSRIASAMEHGFILSPDQAMQVLRQCSRPTPEGVNGTWIVTPQVMAQLEQDLNKLSDLKSHQCCVPGESVRDPSSFFRQYVGVTIRGRKYVYINAIQAPILRRATDTLDAVMHKPFMVCDGGDSAWGALYDTETRQFSELAFNGVA
jgi:hypothetical protein